MRKKEVEVFCRSVEDYAEARRVVALGVDGIINDDLATLEAMTRE